MNFYEDKSSIYKYDFEKEKSDKLITLNQRNVEFRYNENKKGLIFYKKGSNLFKFDPKTKKPELVKNKFKYEYNRFELNRKIFERAWAQFGLFFYDKDMHGINWDKMYDLYSNYLKYAYTPNVLGSIIDEMIGEVNASHTGFYPRRDKFDKSYSRAYLGGDFNRAEFPENGIYFENVYYLSKLKTLHGIEKNDILLAVDNEPIGKDRVVAPLLKDKVDQKIKLKVLKDGKTKEIHLKGLSYWENRNLYYKDWVNTRKQKVDRLSEGRIGYLHIRGMEFTSYEKFLDDLWTSNFDKDALIIDIRNNGGGWTHDMILEVLTKKSYGFTSRRYYDDKLNKTPARTYEKPIVLLINKNSFSDAEIFPHIFKKLNLGKVIGTPTSGSVIGTGHISFMDGSSMRMPSNGWFYNDKARNKLINMEGSGAEPDILVEQSPEELEKDNDVQLKRAVKELFKQLD